MLQLKQQRLWAPRRQGAPPAEPLNNCEPWCVHSHSDSTGGRKGGQGRRGQSRMGTRSWGVAAGRWARWHPGLEPTGQGHTFGHAPVRRGSAICILWEGAHTGGSTICILWEGAHTGGLHYLHPLGGCSHGGVHAICILWEGAHTGAFTLSASSGRVLTLGGSCYLQPPGGCSHWGAPLSAASGRVLTLGGSTICSLWEGAHTGGLRYLQPLELVPLCPWGFCFGAGLFLLGQVVCGRLDLFSQGSSKSPGMVVIRTTPRRAVSSSPSLLQVRGGCDHLSRGA